MRYLIAGLVLIAVGVAFTEYDRRNPSAEGPKDAQQKKTQHVSTTPPTMKALVESQPVEPVTADPTAPVDEALTKLVPEKPGDEKGFQTLLSGELAVRELRGAPGFAVFVFEKGGQQAIVRVAPGQPPKALVARKDVITAVAVDATTLAWAEGSRAYSMPLEGGAITMLVRLDKALVTSLAMKDGLILATLIPKDLDPFSTDPSGAVVQLERGAAKLVAGEQIRPHEVLTDGKDVFFAAGYPSGLVRAALDGSFSSRIAERADGPLAFDGQGIVYRYPLSSGPEVRRSALAGGSTKTLAHSDVDWLTASSGVTRFTTVGIGARLYEVTPEAEPAELLAFKGTAKGLTTAGTMLVLATTDDQGVTTIRAKP